MPDVPDLERLRGWASDPETEAAPVTIPRDTTLTMLICRAPLGTSVFEIGPGEELTIGRTADGPKSLVLDETRVSRRHAKIARRQDHLVAVDLGSRNGTLIGTEVVKKAERVLVGGDIVRIGSAEILVATATSRPKDNEPRTADNVVADPEMERAYALARKVARTKTTVLILGETGVGKEVLARRVHEWSANASQRFVRVNCAAIPETLLESELFGYEKGAFTGADRRKIGYFESAHGGTLFLDEIGELPLLAQVKLLNVLESRSIVRVGDTVPVDVDVRVICATHRDLKRAVAEGKFRADLFYRIGSFVIRIPPLRERPTEIDALACVFAQGFAALAKDATPTLTPHALAALRRYPWPGNVRELRNAIEHAMVMAEGGDTLDVVHLPEELLNTTANPSNASVKDRLAVLERQTVEDALAQENGNQTRAAKRLGISRRALVYKIARYRNSQT
jgi:two-component system, NtrC family, response regulator AtoC